MAALLIKAPACLPNSLPSLAPEYNIDVTSFPLLLSNNCRTLSSRLHLLHSPYPIPNSPKSVRLSSNVAAANAGESMAASAAAAEEPKPFAVLFVCLGNICRSPAAEAVFTDLVRKRGLQSKFKIDSAGTIGYHEGDPADSRMRAAAKRRGVEVTSISRPIRPSDFRQFDLVLAMDMQNRDDILSAYERWRFKEPLPEDGPKKMRPFKKFFNPGQSSRGGTNVPDQGASGSRQVAFTRTANWTPELDACLLALLTEEHALGNNVNGTFTTLAWSRVVTEINRRNNTCMTKEQVKNRLKVMKRKFTLYHNK